MRISHKFPAAFLWRLGMCVIAVKYCGALHFRSKDSQVILRLVAEEIGRWLKSLLETLGDPKRG